MPLGFTLPEDLKIVNGLTLLGAVAPFTSQAVSVKNLQKLFIVISYNQGDADDQQWTPQRAIDIAFGTPAVLANTVPVWSNLDCAASDTLVRRANAINYDSGVGLARKLIIFQIDPARLGLDANGVPYDCVRVVTTDNVEITSEGSITFIGVPRYPGPVDQQLSIITN